jgi:hypothetical protein
MCRMQGSTDPYGVANEEVGVQVGCYRINILACF